MWLRFFPTSSYRELKKKPPPRPTAPKPLLPRREEGEAVEAGDLPEELRSLPPDTFLGAAVPLHFPPGPFPSSAGPGPHYLSGTLPPGTYSGPAQMLQPRGPQALGHPVVAMAPGPALYTAGAYTPELGLVPRSSPQHGMVSSPYGGVGPGPTPPAAGLPSAPPPQFSGPELAVGIRPATTTVDSVQAPISSHTAPRPNPAPAPPRPRFPGPPPQPLPVPYTYPMGAKPPLAAPPAQHHFSPGMPTGFSAPRTGPQPHPTRAVFGPQPPQQPLPLQHPHLFPPQPSGLVPPQTPYPFAPQPGVLGQPPPTLHTQLYPGPSQDPLPPHSGVLPFPSPGPPQPPHPTLAYGPAPSPRPLGPQAPALSIRGPPPASQPAPTPHLVPSPAPSPGPGPVPPRPPAAEPAVCLRRGAASADLLSSSPESQHGGAQPPGGGQPLLQPTKVDAAEGRRPQALRLIEQDPYEHPERLQQLQQELEAFRGQLGDAGALDAIWRELQDAQEHDARGRSIAIARCYSLKNRHQDVMPYDSNRVVLRSGKDDYINASRVEGLSPYCPPLVATQAPLPGTAADFWLMVHEQKVSVIVMLVSEAEMEKVRGRGWVGAQKGNWKTSPNCPVCPSAKGGSLLPYREGPAHGARCPELGPEQCSHHRDPCGAGAEPAVPGPEPQALARAPPLPHMARVVRLLPWAVVGGLGGWCGLGAGLTQRRHPTLQRPAGQPQQSAALHPGGARSLPASAPPAHACRRPLQVGVGSSRAALLWGLLGWPHSPFLPQLRGGPHRSLRAALRGCAGGGGWKWDP